MLVWCIMVIALLPRELHGLLFQSHVDYTKISYYIVVFLIRLNQLT